MLACAAHHARDRDHERNHADKHRADNEKMHHVGSTRYCFRRCSQPGRLSPPGLMERPVPHANGLCSIRIVELGRRETASVRTITRFQRCLSLSLSPPSSPVAGTRWPGSRTPAASSLSMKVGRMPVAMKRPRARPVSSMPVLLVLVNVLSDDRVLLHAHDLGDVRHPARTALQAIGLNEQVDGAGDLLPHGFDAAVRSRPS